MLTWERNAEKDAEYVNSLELRVSRNKSKGKRRSAPVKTENIIYIHKNNQVNGGRGKRFKKKYITFRYLEKTKSSGRKTAHLNIWKS